MSNGKHITTTVTREGDDRPSDATSEIAVRRQSLVVPGMQIQPATAVQYSTPTSRAFRRATFRANPVPRAGRRAPRTSRGIAIQTGQLP